MSGNFIKDKSNRLISVTWSERIVSIRRKAGNKRYKQGSNNSFPIWFSLGIGNDYLSIKCIDLFNISWMNILRQCIFI